MEDILLNEPKLEVGSWWIGLQPIGFTANGAHRFRIPVPVEEEVSWRSFMSRQQLLPKSFGGREFPHANVVSN